ncbi:MAG TPA: phage tail length tape measure family protein, partial [Burkholderiaceae bacterium]|nr:phage tail length tape measure family protein [Burkholderiaceae bacterium]
MSNELVFKLRVDGAAVVGKDIASVGQSIDTLSASSPQAQAALAAATGQINTLGVSARQTAAAMRTLPAQFTDIATQLAGGQSPFLVLLQQGGQIKDSFGGIGAAAKALGSLLTPARVAFGGVAAAAGVLALAYNKGAEESKAYNAALINTGNAAGVTRDQLAGLAQSVGGVVGTQGQAADALAQLAATGKVAGAQLG